MQHDPIDKIIADRYRIGAQIGAGGMGEVFQGVDLETGGTVALKRLRSNAVENDPGLIERFEREADALRQLNHPNIVKVLAKLEEGGIYYIVMEYVSGGSLHDLLSQIKQSDTPLLSIQRVLALGLEIADALTRAHHLKIIHRDLKPANILLAQDGSLRLSDFGVA